MKAEYIINEWQRFNLHNAVNWDNSFSEIHTLNFSPRLDRDFVAEASNKVWVADHLGPAISHCPNVNDGENYAEIRDLTKGNGFYQSCGYNFGPSVYEDFDYGQNCHRDHWQPYERNNPIDIGTAYKDCLYSNYSSSDFNTILERTAIGRCDPYSGDEANIDCEAISQARMNDSPGVPPVFPNECIPGPYGDGVWDWYSQRPVCTYFTPGQFERERVCIETWENCVPIGEGTPNCRDLACEFDQTGIGDCVSRTVNNTCRCPEPNYNDDTRTWWRVGDCDWSDDSGCKYRLDSESCDTCSTANDEETCHEGENCTKYTCSFDEECDCVRDNCQHCYEAHCDSAICIGETVTETKYCSGSYCSPSCSQGYVSKLNYDGLGELTSYVCSTCSSWECGETCTNKRCTSRSATVTEDVCDDPEETCMRDTEFQCDSWSCSSWAGGCINVSCETRIDCPDPFEFYEAEDCCKTWYWKCSAGCETRSPDCYEGRAVRWRPDYDYATFYIGDINNNVECGVNATNQFTIELFVNRNNTPRELEELIKNINDGLYVPHILYSEMEFNEVATSCRITQLSSIKQKILNSGRLVSGDEVGSPHMETFDFGEYLDEFSDKYIRLINFSESRGSLPTDPGPADPGPADPDPVDPGPADPEPETCNDGWIGQEIGGGVVAYCEGDNAVIVQKIDSSSGSSWGCSGTSISTGDSSGYQNTQNIINRCNQSNIAARICANSTEGGYNDWYLPAINQLENLYHSRSVTGGFSGTYWSSTQHTSISAYGLWFTGGSLGWRWYTKNSSWMNVRCIRDLEPGDYTPEDNEPEECDGFQVGDRVGGGIVAYCDGDTPMITQIGDIVPQPGTTWGCYMTTTGANSLQDGYQNTQTIVERCNEENIAARFCWDSNEGGFNDWFLPSRHQITYMYQNRNLIGNFDSRIYWTSTEHNSQFAESQSFSTGSQNVYSKNQELLVRCLRRY